MLTATLATSRDAFAQSENDCTSLLSYTDLKNAMGIAAAGAGSGITCANRGFGNPMWGPVVNRDGVVCVVVFTGTTRDDQWPGSRVISAQKATTANAFSLNSLALSTANPYRLVQPGHSLFGLPESTPVGTDVAYKGPSAPTDNPTTPWWGQRIGGVNVFGGGLARSKDGQVIGGLGVSGDTSCRKLPRSIDSRR